VHGVVDEHAAVEGGDRRPQRQRLDQHLHAPWWPAAGDRERDPGIVELSHGAQRSVLSSFSRVTSVPSTSLSTSLTGRSTRPSLA